MNYNFGSLKGLLETATSAIFLDTYADEGAMKLLNEWKPAQRGAAGADCETAAANENRGGVAGGFRRLTYVDANAGSSEAGTACA